MAQFFETFTVSSMDNQTAVAVQSLLESQSVPETPQAEEEDVFQCGKCKKQFSSLVLFLNHKQSRCLPQRTLQQLQPMINSNLQPTSSTTNQSHNVYQSIVSRPQQLSVQQGTSLPPSYAIPPSPMTQLTQNMVLTDDLMSFANVDQTLGGSTIHLGSAIHSAGPFLSQMATYTTRSSNNVAILSPINSTASLQPSNGSLQPSNGSLQSSNGSLQPSNGSLQPSSGLLQPSSGLLQPSSGSAFTSTVSTNQIQVQAAPQQVTLTTIPEKPIAPNVAKPSPTKAGRKSAQASLVTVISADDASLLKVKRSKSGNLVLDDKKKLRCQYCDKSFSKNFDLQQHIRAHTGEKPFQCIVCGRAFAQKSNVKKHMATHKVWPAGIGSTLPSQPPPAQVVQEEETPPNSENTVEMTSVEEAAQTIIEIPIHPNQESGDLSDNSKQDDAIDQDLSEERVKILVDNSYICQYCPAKFKSYFQLKTHMVQHKKEQVYRCVMKSCILTFRDLDMFLEHIKQHENEMTYRCHMCNKFFPSLYELGLHQYTHSLYPNQGPKPGPRHFQCTKCMNKYSTPEALEHHLSTSTHSHPCPHCNKKFTCERYLRRHLPSHGSEGQFACQTCKKKFKAENYLRMHMLIHSGEKPFECELCNAAFNRKDKLKRHMLIHDTSKRYRCPFKSLTGCNKEFNRPDKLKSHIITHSGIKPYKCRECGRAFSRKPHLKEHERGHRADFKFKCESCGKGFFRPKLYKEHKCQPLRPGQSHIYRPRSKRKVGRPKKRMITITAEMLKDVSERSDFYKKRGRQTSDKTGLENSTDITNDETSQLENEAEMTSSDDYKQKQSLDDKDDHVYKRTTKQEFCVKVSTAPTQDSIPQQYLTVHIQNPVRTGGQEMHAQFLPASSCSPGDSPSHATLQPLAQVLSATGSSHTSLHPITIIETQPVHMSLPVHVAAVESASAGDALPMQMAAITGNDGVTHHASPICVSEIVPVQVAIPGGSDSMVTTHVVVTSSGDQAYGPCASHIVEDFGATDNDPVLQGTENFLNAHAEILQSAQQ